MCVCTGVVGQGRAGVIVGSVSEVSVRGWIVSTDHGGLGTGEDMKGVGVSEEGAPLLALWHLVTTLPTEQVCIHMYVLGGGDG